MKILVTPLILSIIFCCISATSIYSQDPGDCLWAIEICDLQPIQVSAHGGTGLVNENSILQSCLNSEFNSTWFKMTFNTSGIFHFIITPSTFPGDIDFIVFQSISNACQNLNPIRCMLSGENVGLPIDTPCVGPTGLLPGSSDFSEPAGCPQTSDGFLAPLDVNPGDVYYLFVNDFRLLSDTTFYTIEFFGTAGLTCTTSSESSFEEQTFDFTFYPNPASDWIEIQCPKTEEENIDFIISDAAGRVCSRTKFQGSPALNIPVDHFSSGLYTITMHKNQMPISTKTFIIK